MILMPIKKVVDSNIFIYSLLKDHPAHADCTKFLIDNEGPNVLFSLVECFDEIYRILHTFYRIDPSTIVEKITGLKNSTVEFWGFNTEKITDALKLVSETKVDIVDAKLYFLAMDIQAPIIITDDARFQNFIKSRGLLFETPISEATRRKMQEWEKHNIPAAGLPRILSRVYRYLLKKGANIANQFKADTKGFSALLDE